MILQRPVPPTEFSPTQKQDIVIIGAGVVGCALARECASRGFTVTILEKGIDFLGGASKANSAILHTGFDAPTDSLEHQCLVEGYRRYVDLAHDIKLPIRQCGAIVIAWTDEQHEKLDEIKRKALANSIVNIQSLSTRELLNQIQGLSTHAKGGALVPGESVIDPWTTPYAYLCQALDAQAHLVRQCEVLSGSFNSGTWQLETTKGIVTTGLVINCAGLYGDIVTTRLTGSSNYQIKPRKGQFIVYDKAASRVLNTILLPIPDKRTKGIVICPTIFGNVLVGPTAEEQKCRREAATDQETLTLLKQHAERILPELKSVPITATYAGLRPATEQSDYQISFHQEKHYIDVGGIRSTGLSAALGIAAYVTDELEGRGQWPSAGQKQTLSAPSIPTLDEAGHRDWQKPDNGGIICHCEHVTRREVITALNGPLAATNLQGLKRRTRVTMGRCQGFYCSAELSELTAGKLEPSMTVDK
ncbi:MAG: glycerol-3-phosphate dehydrogenase [Saprospiraceae bacterium]|jgi:glycerol-3-phosphate dehydrogenase